jgi:hypothetical protein
MNIYIQRSNNDNTSKGIVMWECTIVSVYMTILGRSSNIVLRMLATIKCIDEDGIMYNWVEHLGNNLIKTCEECHENNKGIRYSALLIYISMEKISL